MFGVEKTTTNELKKPSSSETKCNRPKTTTVLSRWAILRATFLRKHVREKLQGTGIFLEPVAFPRFSKSFGNDYSHRVYGVYRPCVQPENSKRFSIDPDGKRTL